MNVDVVVVTYNSAKELPDLFTALDSAAPVTVVDNASSDDSAAVAEALGAHVIRGEVNAGFGAGCNRGALRGSADYLLFLNPDARIAPADLEQLVAAFDANPDFAIGSPQLYVTDGRPQRVVWPFPRALDSWAEALGIERLFPNWRADFVVGACLFVRRSAFEAVAGFDERIWLYGEETDLCRRVRDAGGTVAVVSEARATHIGGASGGTVRGLVREHFVRGGEHFVDKHDGNGCAGLVSARSARGVGGARRAPCWGDGSTCTDGDCGRMTEVLLKHPTTVSLDSPATVRTRQVSRHLFPGALGRGLAPEPVPRPRAARRSTRISASSSSSRRSTCSTSAAGAPAADTSAASGPSTDDGRIIRLEPVKLLPRRLGPLANRLRDRQVKRAVEHLGVRRPCPLGQRPVLRLAGILGAMADPVRRHRRLDEGSRRTRRRVSRRTTGRWPRGATPSWCAHRAWSRRIGAAGPMSSWFRTASTWTTCGEPSSVPTTSRPARPPSTSARCTTSASTFPS